MRAIVINGDKMLVMHRNKFGKEYDTLAGGGVDHGESLGQALIREINEETMIRIANPRLLFIEHAGQPYGDQYIFLCEYIKGEPALWPNSDEAAINKLGKNLYKPMWMNLDELSQKPFVSQALKQKLLVCLQQGWPVVPEEF